MNEIEIGIKITPNIYLHVEGEELGTSFESDKIADVTEFKDGAIVTYMEGYELSNMVSSHYFVTENAEEIREAINTSLDYKAAALKAIGSIIGGESR